MPDAAKIIKDWCDACGMPEPSDGECHALAVAISAAAQAVLLESVPSGMCIVNAGALQMVINALRRDAEEGKVVRGEMADELLSTVGQAQSAAPKMRPEAWLATFRPKGVLTSHSVADTSLEELKRSVPSDSKFKPLYAQPILTIVGMLTTAQPQQGETAMRNSNDHQATAYPKTQGRGASHVLGEGQVATTTLMLCWRGKVMHQ